MEVLTMLVHELIELLQRCPQDAIVGYDFENAFTNDEAERLYGFDRENRPREFYMGIDDALIGHGTAKGFVFLTEDLIPERGAEDAR
jgi:hypothetical protein